MLAFWQVCGGYLDCVNCGGKTEDPTVEGTILQPGDAELSGDSYLSTSNACINLLSLFLDDGCGVTSCAKLLPL